MVGTVEKLKTTKPAASAKAKYHHGDLRGALIGAARQLVEEKGAENFSLADACRVAGVSTAAPYRHFRDKDEILGEVTAAGFDELAQRMQAEVDQHGDGTLDGIIEMGRTYVDFAVEQPGVQGLMFGHDGSIKSQSMVQQSGEGCFGKLIGQVSRYCADAGLKGDPGEMSLQLWTFVHGAAALKVDGAYDRKAPALDVGEMISKAVRRLLH